MAKVLLNDILHQASRSDISTFVKPLQLEKAEDSIDVTELGMVTDVKPRQPSKADEPIEVTEFPIVTDVKPLQLWKVQSPIVLTELGITKSFISLPFKYKCLA